MEIKNAKLRKELEEAGLGCLHLEKGNGYFWVWADNDVASEILGTLPSTSILYCHFNHISPRQWFLEMYELYKRGYYLLKREGK